MPSALEGIRVLELAPTLPGPYCGRLLAELGADVIKVEAPTGDPLRGLMPDVFRAANRGKRSVVLDLKRAGVAATVERLAVWADVVLEGYRPGVAERLGVGPEHLRAVNPRIVYCRISG